MKRLVPLAILGLLALTLVAPAGAAASSEHYAHPYYHLKPSATSSPTGYSPSQIKTAYGFVATLDPTHWPGTNPGVGTTIAIVDAYNDPTAESDLSVFSSTFGLPPCTTANGCFSKVNQGGTTSYPRTNSGWALEIALDIEWAHAIAPGAKILLVEATTNSFTNLLMAEVYANGHANYLSNSWGGSEFSGESSNDRSFAAGQAFASSGDSGLPAQYPSSSPNVISVGGTTLTLNADNTEKTETGWSGSGGGCSAYEAKPAAQSTGTVDCASKRGTPDVSLVADPATGVSIYDTTKYQGQGGWFKIGGTSVSSPITAAHAAVRGGALTLSTVYGNTLTFRDIRVGNNGASCLLGYDLVTGRGSWL